MIVCEICESAQFLQIIESHVRLTGIHPTEFEEKYECTWCGPTAVGSMELTDDGKELTGAITEKAAEKPRAQI